MTTIKKSIAVTCLLLLVTIAAFSQGPGFDEGVEDTPIDGGVSLIIVAAACYGVKKVRDRRYK